MNTIKDIKSKIRFAFGDVEFPSHCGWHAAIAKDDWVSDPQTLIQITNKRDVKGAWWEIPYSGLTNCSMAQCYLDAKGVEFYLPAYMTGVIENVERPNYCHLISWLCPGKNSHECNLYDYFCENFSLITNSRREVCVVVLNYILDNLDATDRYSKKDIEHILNHRFWATKC